MDNTIDRTQYHIWKNPCPTVYNYTVARSPILEPLWFERFDPIETYHASLNWRAPAFIASLVYILLSWLGPKWMKNREPFNLKTLFAVWNGGIGLFSAIALCRTAPDQLYLLYTVGFHRFFCEREGLGEIVLFWANVILWSKLVQFGDTVFLILQKKPLNVVHVVHHVTMCYFAFHLSPMGEPLTRIMNLNLLVHSFFYNYKALQAMGVKFSDTVPMFILFLEMIQALLVLFVSTYTTFYWAKGNCVRNIDSIVIYNLCAVLILTLYMVFFRDYVPSWMKKREKIKEKTN